MGITSHPAKPGSPFCTSLEPQGPTSSPLWAQFGTFVLFVWSWGRCLPSWGGWKLQEAKDQGHFTSDWDEGKPAFCQLLLKPRCPEQRTESGAQSREDILRCSFSQGHRWSHPLCLPSAGPNTPMSAFLICQGLPPSPKKADEKGNAQRLGGTAVEAHFPRMIQDANWIRQDPFCNL